MIKKILFIFLIFSLFIVPAKAQVNKFLTSQFLSPKSKSEFLLFLSKNYSSNAFSILNKKPFDFYTRWAKGKHHFEILSSYATVVHETCHSVNSDIGGFFSMGYYISPNINIKVSKSDVFKSNELDKIIPDSWKSRIFRYKTYIQGIDDEDEISSVTNGIFGLMDEFDAYYQSTRAVVELYDYYKTIASYTEPYYWTLYFANCYSSIFAYHEFRLFIAWYLKYARKNYPAIFNSLTHNQNLKVTYTLIDNGYNKVIEQYFKNRNIILENINKAGKKKAEISDKYFIIHTKRSNDTFQNGYGIPDSEINFIKSIYTIEDLQILKMLTIDKLNESNFKSFLE